MSKSKHVVPNSKGGWAVRSAGAGRAERIFASQSEAVSYAKERARENHSELYIHRRDGTILTKQSFGGDPFPVKG